MKTLKGLIIACLVSMAIATIATAEEKSITLSYNYTDPADSFRAYERLVNGKELLAEVPGDQRTITATKDLSTDECHTFFIAAVVDGVESFNSSNGITWCPESTMPDYVTKPAAVTGTTVTVIVNQ